MNGALIVRVEKNVLYVGGYQPGHVQPRANGDRRPLALCEPESHNKGQHGATVLGGWSSTTPIEERKQNQPRARGRIGVRGTPPAPAVRVL